MLSITTPGGWNQTLNLATLGLSMAGEAPVPLGMVEGSRHLVRYANPAFCKLLGQAADKIVGAPFAAMLPGQSRCLEVLNRVLSNGTSELYVETEPFNAHSAPWSYTMWPIILNEQSVGVMILVTENTLPPRKTVEMNEALVLGSLRQHELAEAADLSNVELQAEIREHERAKTALHQAQAQLTDRAGQLEGLVNLRTLELSATNNQLEAFVYSIAHDLRAPLRAMQGFSTMLVDEAGPGLNANAKDYAGRINIAAQSMDAMLTDLLAFSRISQQHVELKPVKLKRIVESVLARLQPDIQERKARVESAGPWPTVLAHEATLAQVVFNLASNALKFMVPGTVPMLCLRAEETGALIRVWVEDNGPGIALEHQSQIFRVFTRLAGEKYPGTGIGLAIVQKGLERMNGRVGLESLPGHGSRFWFELQKA